MIEFVEEQSVDDKLEVIMDKLDHMNFHGNIISRTPYSTNGEERSVTLELTREGEAFKLPPTKPKEPKPIRKLSELDWLNIMNYYKMLLDGFKGADWSQDNVREQVATTMIKKTRDFFEKNYPDLIEIKKRAIFERGDIK